MGVTIAHRFVPGAYSLRLVNFQESPPLLASSSQSSVAPRTLDTLDWSPHFGALPERFYTRMLPTPLPKPYLVALHQAGLPLIGLADDKAVGPELIEYFSGNLPLPGATPFAAVYAGHQFGSYVPQLGDGRAITLGEVVGSEGICEVQLKGAGKTPYSRAGDGRAVLRSSIREYLCSEAMHSLGIPTTRALAIVGSDQVVMREEAETSAVVTRLSPSFVRFGTFEFWYHRRDTAALKTLADFVIDTFYPEISGASERYALFLRAVVRRTARLIAQWQAVGFMHGVMNSDNMSILGLTLDYGPFGFMEAFNPNHICNHSDDSGRYAYNMQPQIGLWNLYCLGQALVPLMAPDVIEAQLATYDAEFSQALDALLRAKLGLKAAHDEDRALIDDLFALMAASKVDFTLFFRKLSELSAAGSRGDAAVRDMTIDTPRFDAWAARYRSRLQAEHSMDVERRAAMDRINPKYVLRNYLAEAAIRKARETRDYSEIERLRCVLAHPFDEQPENAHYAALPPDWAAHLEVSCSS